MPPRKRRANRAKGGSDASAKRRERYEQIMFELAVRVQTKLNEMDTATHKAITMIESIFHTVEMNMSQSLKKMTIGTYKTSGDPSRLLPTNSPQLGNSNTKRVDEINALVEKISSAKKTSTTKKAKTRRALNSDSSVIRKAAKKSQQEETFSSPPRMRRRPSSKTIITPKFDLRKPVAASRCRAPHPEELVVSLSGSPLRYAPRAGSEPCLVSVRGKILDLDALASSSNLDRGKKLKLLKLQNQIARLMN